MLFQGGVPVATYVGASDAGAAGVAAVPVVEGKMLRQVATARGCNDVAFAVLWLLATAAAFVGGAHVTNNAKAAGDALSDCESFKADMGQQHNPGGLEDDFENSLPAVGGGLLVVVLVAVIVSVVYLCLLESQARFITWCSVCCMPVLIFCTGIVSWRKDF